MAKKITIKKGQLGLVAKAGDYYRVLEAGEHRLGWFNTDDVLVVSQDGSEVPDALADYLRRFQPDWVVRYCLAVDLTADEIGVLSNNGVLQEIVPPSTRRLYWQQDAALTLQRIDTRDVRVPVDVMNAALPASQWRAKGARRDAGRTGTCLARRGGENRRRNSGTVTAGTDGLLEN